MSVNRNDNAINKSEHQTQMSQTIGLCGELGQDIYLHVLYKK